MPVTMRQRVRHRGRPILALTLALLLASLALPAPATIAQETGVTGVTNPTIRIVHAVPDGPAVDVVLDDELVVQEIAFGTATEYLPVAPGDRLMHVVPTSGGDPIIDQTIGLEGATAYIFVVTGSAAEPQLQTFEVGLDPIEAGQARLRVIHAAPEAPGVEVAVVGSGEPLVDGVGFPDGSDYQLLTPGTYDLEVRLDDSGEVITSATAVTIETGKAYDIVALGEAGTPNVSLLTLESLISLPCSEILGVGERFNTCLRMLHAVPDAAAIDLYVGETLVAEGLAYSSATEFVAAPNGEQQIRIVPAGGSLDQALADTTQTLERGLAYQITATGLAAEGIEATISGVDLSALPENQARVRVNHASPDTGEIDVAVAGGPTPFEGIEYRTQSGYVAFDAGSYVFQLRLSGEETLLIETPEVQLEPGMIYDIYAIGQSENGTVQLVIFATEVGIQEGEATAATPLATPMMSPAAETTPVVAAGATPVVATPGGGDPAATPSS